MDLDQALDYFLATRGDLRTDLILASQEAAKRRKEGPEATALIVTAMHEQLGMTYTEIERESSHPDGYRISRVTAARLVAGKGS
ncbi:MAG: hypothetical protein ACREQ5_01605 [Candidatus Dormibacteria bacterium]